MSEPREDEHEEQEGAGLSSVVTGFGQKLIGVVEEVGGILTGDPVTAAEGEFNVEVGEVREEVEEELEGASDDHPAGGSW